MQFYVCYYWNPSFNTGGYSPLGSPASASGALGLGALQIETILRNRTRLQEYSVVLLPPFASYLGFSLFEQPHFRADERGEQVNLYV